MGIVLNVSFGRAQKIEVRIVQLSAGRHNCHQTPEAVAQRLMWSRDQ